MTCTVRWPPPHPILNRGIAALAVLLLTLAAVPARGQEAEPPLQGEFAVTVTAEDVPPTLIDGPMLIGLWQVGFAPDGTYSRGRQDVGTLATGRYVVAGDQLILTGETGLLACGLDDESKRDAVYTWGYDEQRLRLTPVDEPCPSRRVILTTRSLATYVACPAAAPSLASPVAAAPATPVATAPPAESDIDAILARMSSCWATRQPERFLTLLSRDFRASLATDHAAELRRLALTMASPVVWDRVAPIAPIGPGRFSAKVRQTAGDEVDFVVYAFVQEDGAWRWDGVVAAP